MTVFANHTAFPIPAALPRLVNSPLAVYDPGCLPSFIARPESTRLLWVPRGQADVR